MGTSNTKTIDQLEAELEATRNELFHYQHIMQSVLDDTLAGYWDWKIREEYEYMSPAMKRLFGYEPHEIEDTPAGWAKMVHPDDIPMIVNTFEKHVASKGEFPFDLRVRYFHKNKSIVWVYCKATVVEWEGDEPLRVIGCHIDITPQMKAEETNKYVDDLEKKNELLEQLAYIAAHDLYEPILTVQSFGKLLKKSMTQSEDATNLKYIDYICKSSEKADKLVRGMLDYSVIGRSKTKKKIESSKLVEQILDELKIFIDVNGAAINYTQLPVILGYEEDIHLLFKNLIVNGIKFRRETAPIITIECNELTSHWEFSITDNGIGIVADKYDAIFKLFRKLHSNNTYEGTGIGLAQCKRVVENHNGSISLQSEVNQGSKFIFTISK